MTSKINSSNQFAYEFKIVVDITDEVMTPVYEELTKKQQKAYKAKRKADGLGTPKDGWKKIMVGEEQKIVVITKGLTYKKRFPDVRSLVVSEGITEQGTIYKNRFLVEDINGKSYLVKGKYATFNKYLNNLSQNKNKIGYAGN